MRMMLGAIVAVVAVITWAGSVGASRCPGLIAQAREALEQFKKTPGVAAVKDAKIAAVEANIRSAQGAHDAEEHDESVRQAREALKLLGK